jgi:Phasin protein
MPTIKEHLMANMSEDKSTAQRVSAAAETSHKAAAETSHKVAEATEAVQKATQSAAGKAGEQTARVAEAAAKTGDRAARAGAEIMQRHAETVQQALQSGASMAARMAERSAGQFGRVMGLSGDEAENAARASRDNIDVIMHSSTVLAEAGQRFAGEWMDFAHDRIERNFQSVERMLHCRTPQDFAALQSDLMRENLHKFLDYARRVSEQSLRVADEATKRFDETTERNRHRAA